MLSVSVLEFQLTKFLAIWASLITGMKSSAVAASFVFRLSWTNLFAAFPFRRDLLYFAVRGSWDIAIHHIVFVKVNANSLLATILWARMFVRTLMLLYLNRGSIFSNANNFSILVVIMPGWCTRSIAEDALVHAAFSAVASVHIVILIIKFAAHLWTVLALLSTVAVVITEMLDSLLMAQFLVAGGCTAGVLTLACAFMHCCWTEMCSFVTGEFVTVSSLTFIVTGLRAKMWCEARTQLTIEVV